MLEKPSPEDLVDYFAISLKAVSAELRALPARDSSYSTLTDAFDCMLVRLAKEDAERFKRVWGGDLYVANDKDACCGWEGPRTHRL